MQHFCLLELEQHDDTCPSYGFDDSLLSSYSSELAELESLPQQLDRWYQL
jgi:hypothetical protein